MAIAEGDDAVTGPDREATATVLRPKAPEMLPPARIRVSWSQRLSDYLELTKPRLSLMALFTVVVGYFVAAPSAALGIALPATVVGVFLVTASGAIFNQYLERSFDRRMHRTQQRPLAAGRIGAAEAAWLGGVAGLTGAVILALLVNPLTAALTVTAWYLYVVVYTPLKRRTTWNTWVGAVAGALPPVMGFAAAGTGLGLGAALLFAMQFLWQIPHFFAIAWLYRADYERGGFRMLSVVDPDGRRTMSQVRGFSLLLVPVTLGPALAGLAGPLYLTAALVLGVAFVACALRTAKERSLDSARSLFVASILYLPALLGILLVDRLLAA